jgi:hypothetical protein
MRKSAKGQLSRNSITIEMIDKHLYFDKNKGIFFRKIYRDRAKTNHDGSAFLSKSESGPQYHITISRMRVCVLWLAWVYIHHRHPPMEMSVRPANNDWADARPKNLTLVCRSDVGRKEDPSQYHSLRGVRKKGQRYVTTVRANNEIKYWGSFKTPGEASKAYRIAKLEIAESKKISRNELTNTVNKKMTHLEKTHA